jgi:hypothetical protein
LAASGLRSDGMFSHRPTKSGPLHPTFQASSSALSRGSFFIAASPILEGKKDPRVRPEDDSPCGGLLRARPRGSTGGPQFTLSDAAGGVEGGLLTMMTNFFRRSGLLTCHPVRLALAVWHV